MFDLKSERWIGLSYLLLLMKKKKNLKKSKSLNFYATLGENNEGCQKLSYSATRNKKIALFSATVVLFKLYSSTIQLYSTLIFLPAFPTFNFKPQ